ncbi:MAG: ATP-binding protein [Pirellulales bacterium]|nr:ATP-binding protein [Pirellulales bacterium]
MLKRVRIKNYKSLDVDVELDPITVLIGKSGTGKTNFVEALRFLRDSVRNGSNSVGDVLSRTAIRPFDFLYEVTFGIAGRSSPFDYKLAYHLAAQAGLRLHEEYLAINQARVFHQIDGKMVVNTLGAGAPQSVVLATPIADRTAQQARAYLSKGIGCYNFAERLPMQDSERAAGLTDQARNLPTALDVIKDDLDSPESYDRITQSLQKLNPTVKSWNTGTGGSGVQIVHGFGGVELPMDLALESDGMRKFLACMAALYQRPPKQVIIIEEPENGIHPGALATLAEEFKACPEEGRGQVILTTHSPQFLDHFDIENIRLVEIDSQGVTRINRIADDQVEAIKDGLMSPGELFTVDEARSGAIIEPEA